MKTSALQLIIIALAIITLPLSLTAQDGNYSLMKYGDRCPFDTAVAINIGQYRNETLKFDLCDSLITALQIITDNQRQQISTFQNRVINLQELNIAYESEIERKSKVNADLFIEYQKMSMAYAKERTWFKRNGKWFAFGAGIVIGGIGTYYIVR